MTSGLSQSESPASASRRDAVYFLLGPAVVAVLAATLFHVHPWPVSLRAQAQNFDWPITLWWIAVGLAGVAVSSRIGCPPAPERGDTAGWRRVVAWGLGIGLAQGLVGVAETLFPPLGRHYQALDRAAGFTWGNVALPWSIPHYAHAAVISECFFRFAAIAIPVWLLSSLLLKGRFQTPIYWVFAVLSALIEPFENLVVVKHVSFASMPLIDQIGMLSGILWELVYAWTFRRFGWPAPILMRFGWYLIYRVSAGYFFPHDSTMYPGPH